MTSGLKVLEAITTLSKIEELEEGDRDLLLRAYRKELECAFDKLQGLLQPASNSTTQSCLEISAPADFFLTPEQSFEHVQAILSEIKNIIKDYLAGGMEVTEEVWGYSGPELSNGTAKLATKITQLGEDKIRVIRCAVVHIENVTDGISHSQAQSVLLFPHNGNAYFGPNEPLPRCHCIKENRKTFGENINIIVAILERNDAV